MTLQTAMFATAIAILGVVQYALCVQALRDLARRPRVRGENKVLWGLGILCVPIAGAIVYNWMGPTSFMRRPVSIDRGELPRAGRTSNVTSISEARSTRRRRVTSRTTPSVRARTSRRAPVPVSRIDRTGS